MPSRAYSAVTRRFGRYRATDMRKITRESGATLLCRWQKTKQNNNSDVSNAGVRLCVDLTRLNRYVRQYVNPVMYPYDAVSGIEPGSRYFITQATFRSHSPRPIRISPVLSPRSGSAVSSEPPWTSIQGATSTTSEETSLSPV